MRTVRRQEIDRVTGRYIQSDPIGFDGGINTYLYANGNSLMFVDELGLYCRSKHPFKNIMSTAFINAGKYGLTGGGIGGLTAGPLGATAGVVFGAIGGFASGLVKGVVFEATGVNCLKDKLKDKAIEYYEENF